MKNRFTLFFCLVVASAIFPDFCAAQFKKANGLFKERKYAAAIPLYQDGLTKKESLLAKSRLAFCYRMLNQTEEAEQIYATIVDEPRARAETLRFYAEALMGNAKYGEAKIWFEKYLHLEPLDSSAYPLLQACDIAPTLKPYFQQIAVREFAQNSEQDDNTPLFFEGSIIFTSDRPSGALIKQKSGFTGRDYLRIYQSAYNKDQHIFEKPEDFSARLNSFKKNTANPSFAYEENAIYYSQNNSEGTERGEYKLQLYRSGRSSTGKWKRAEKLPFCKSDFNYMHPAASPDGKWVFFISDIKGQGGFDLFVAERKEDGTWRQPYNLGEVVNSAGHEAFPYFHKDGRLFFASKGHPGIGGFDIFVSIFDSAQGQWKKPLNLGRPINSPADDISFSLSQNDSTGLFASSRSGGDDDIFLFWLGGKKRLETALFPNPQDNAPSSTTDLPTLLKLELHPSVPTLETLARELESSRKLSDEAFILQHAVYSSQAETEVPVSAGRDLALLLDLIDEQPKLTFTIGIHGSPALGEAESLALCEERAAAWQTLLINSGVPKDRFEVIPYGNQVPTMTCPDCGLNFVERIDVKVSTN